MLNIRLLTAPADDPAGFVAAAVKFLQKHAAGKKVFCALSGGIDSAATYLLLKKTNINTLPVFIDHGLMRIIRGKEEREYIKKQFPDVRILDIRNEFLPQIFGEGDAEAKRKLFKKAYSTTIDKVIKEEACELLSDGTILPDLEESFGTKITELKESMTTEEETAIREKKKGKGFVKSQHNVEIEYAVEATVQPVACLTKQAVRKVLEYLGMPPEMVYRKAFPGPALAARIVGPVTADNLAFEKQVHDIVESMVDDFYVKKHGKPMLISKSGEQEPFQAFAATMTDVLTVKVTGIVNDRRAYESPLCVRTQWDYDKLTKLAAGIKEYSRVFFELGGNASGKYDVVIRSINSMDARTASVTNLPPALLQKMCDTLKGVAGTRTVYVDVTPKPPATIEYV